ncbi:MAG: VWA domain-containing protein [ANME-2 cluster archaeon]|nr:VWA domain-containing protein [ANME-2 cluster archaeon]MBC2701873.1 VWA domain-containing protein [ANME-2 cluster archaeon]MBC2707338.1 VWA domain-containing protein [ANME-2 cluster archaeon]MBC2747197.1 VWA domain-containing protein [ANME-2 cluster archaeon]MBC2764306.1 VWA domain-containing protein [ANME-2 cluster archaeon]
MIIEIYKLIFDKPRINDLFTYLIVALTISVLSFIPAVTAELPDNPNSNSPVLPNDSDIPLIEVVFLLDSTGSMSDEILSVKSHIQNILEDTMSGNPRPDLRIGIVTYRDHSPEDETYIYKMFDLTTDIDQVMDDLRDINAMGGGDGPEAVADGLHAAVHDMDWSGDAMMVIFLIGDAPPHGLEGNGDSSFKQGCPLGYDYLEESELAAELGITIHSLGCSGIKDYNHGTDVFKEISKTTGGKYERLEYRRVVAVDYYESEMVAPEYADASKDTTYDEKSGTILISNLNSITGWGMRSAAMEAGVSYTDTFNKTGSPHYNGTGGVPLDDNKDIPTLLGLSFVALLLVVASAVVMVRRHR